MASNAPPPPPPPAQSDLEKVIRKCIPKELIPDTWKCIGIDGGANMSSLFDEGESKFEMFESPLELINNIVGYMQFPKIDDHPRTQEEWDRRIQVQPFPHCHKIWKKEKWCMYRNDLAKIFDYQEFGEEVLPKEAWNTAEWVLESCWMKLRTESHHKMIVCPYQPEAPSYEDDHLQQPYEVNSRSGWTDFKGYWKDEASEMIGTMAEFIVNEVESLLKPLETLKFQVAAEIISWVGHVMEQVAKFVRKEKGIIDLPPIYSVAPPNKPKEVLRLFSIDKKQFVMAHELLDILQKNGTSSDEMKTLVPQKLRKQKLSTLPLEAVEKGLEEIANDDLLNMEFAEMRTDLLMFTQAPIPTHNGGYCIFASDALYELLMNMVVVKKVFLTILDDDWEKINNFFESVKIHFDTNREAYFLDSNTVDAIKKEWENVYNGHLKRPISVAKPFNGRNADELTKRLKWLKLDKCFEKIVEYAHPVLQKLEAKKQEEKKHFEDSDHPIRRKLGIRRREEKKPLSDSDMQVAVALCQINCLARKFEWILDFIRKQDACNRMNIVDLFMNPEKYNVDDVVAELEKMTTKKQDVKGSSGSKSKNKNKKSNRKN